MLINVKAVGAPVVMLTAVAWPVVVSIVTVPLITEPFWRLPDITKVLIAA